VKINVNYARKAGRENYGSENFSLAIETEPPPEIAQDREKLRGYVEALFDEVKARVEDQIVAAGEREPAPERSATDVSDTGSRRAPPPRPPVRSMRRPVPNGNGHANGTSNGRGAPNGEGVSLKQIGYMRSLARDAHLSNDQLALLCEEATGKSDIRSLTKREASGVIETLKANAA
jgi:hypothetical protein